MPTIDPAAAIADIDRVLTEAEQPNAGGAAYYEQIAALAACVDQWLPRGHVLRKETDAAEAFEDLRWEDKTKGVLRFLRAAYQRGDLANFEQRVHGSVFADLLQHARDLAADGYLMAAAVVAGAALEEHLRKLCDANKIDTKKSNGDFRAASDLKTDLYNAKVYLQTEMNLIQSRLDLRNEAAHAKPEFKTRTGADIAAMIDDIARVMTNHPA